MTWACPGYFDRPRVKRRAREPRSQRSRARSMLPARMASPTTSARSLSAPSLPTRRRRPSSGPPWSEPGPKPSVAACPRRSTSRFPAVGRDPSSDHADAEGAAANRTYRRPTDNVRDLGITFIEALRGTSSSNPTTRYNASWSSPRTGWRSEMKRPYLEITFRRGKPMAAYLYLRRYRSTRSRLVGSCSGSGASQPSSSCAATRSTL